MTKNTTSDWHAVVFSLVEESRRGKLALSVYIKLDFESLCRQNIKDLNIRDDFAREKIRKLSSVYVAAYSGFWRRYHMAESNCILASESSLLP